MNLPSLPLFSLPEPELTVLKEQEEWLVVVKPRGLSTVPAPHGYPDLLTILKERGYGDLRTISRLDRAAGGLVLLARTARAQRILTEAWHAPHTLKLYLAGTLAPPNPQEGEISLPIAPGRRRTSMRVGKGKPARTRYRLAGKAPQGFYWVLAHPLTGRRHQLRLHLGSLGAPIAGDTLYLPYFRSLFPGRFPEAPPLPPTPPERLELYCIRVEIPELSLLAQLPGAPLLSFAP